MTKDIQKFKRNVFQMSKKSLAQNVFICKTALKACSESMLRGL